MDPMISNQPNTSAFAYTIWSDIVKKSKIFVPIVVVILIIILVVVIRISIGMNRVPFFSRPVDQPDTTWESKDGSICFTVESDNDHFQGVIIIDGEEKEIIVQFVGTRAMYIYDKSSEQYRYDEILGEEIVDYDETLLVAGCYYYADSKFIAIVGESSDYFKEGQRISFTRVEKI